MRSRISSERRWGGRKLNRPEMALTCRFTGPQAYMASLHQMFPKIPLIASGGVTQQNASNFILAGAVALGVGRELIPSDAIRRRQEARIGELARRFLGFVKAGRDHLAARARRSAGPNE